RGKTQGVKGLPYAVAFLAGATAILGFSPFDHFPATLGALAILIHLWLDAVTPRAAFKVGFFFGLGLYGAGASWVYISLHRFGAMPLPLAATATLAWCAFLALFPALAGWLQARIARDSAAPVALRAALLIPATWTLVEWSLSWFLTGFPWLAFGYTAINDVLSGFAPVGGVYAVTLAMAVAAGLAWCAALGHARWIAAGALALLLACSYGLRTTAWTVPTGKLLRVALLQGNVPQEMKFDPERYERTLDSYARLAESSEANLIVLPETAVPRFLDQVDPAYLERLKAAAVRNRGDLLLGVPARSGPGIYLNSAISLGVSPPARYDKVHLVPFGEFVPPGFGWIVSTLAIPLADFSRGSIEQRPMAIAGQRVAVNICYEDAYGAEIIRQLPEATLLVNISNVAWFGDSIAPAQHLQIARMRALETGRTYLTAANTGITAAIGPDGTVRVRMAQFVRGQSEVFAVGFSGATPYVRFGDWPAVLLALLAMAFVALRRSR
ncbi:MAG TPA: apolipoprotein N-acyltransferase, partial [Steroidobacteraceae bacterium]|nr:apolipoprotein N-acyltransferase [Steroidobacteraceae bacterium]